MGAQKDCSNVFVSMVCIVLSGQNKWDHCTHLTWKLGHWLKWDHYKHPLLYHCVLCGGDLFSLDHVCGYQYDTYGSCRDSDQGTTLRASDLHNSRATILNPFNSGLGILFLNEFLSSPRETHDSGSCLNGLPSTQLFMRIKLNVPMYFPIIYYCIIFF